MSKERLTPMVLATAFLTLFVVIPAIVLDNHFGPSIWQSGTTVCLPSNLCAKTWLW